MKLENQVCTLEQAKRLTELGVSAFSRFTWWLNSALENTFVGGYSDDTDHPHLKDLGNAYNVAELGEMLSAVRYESYGFPMMFTSYCHSSDVSVEYLGKWSCSFRNPRCFTNPDIKSDYEAHARAAMLIYLLENNLTAPEVVNQRLNDL